MRKNRAAYKINLRTLRSLLQRYPNPPVDRSDRRLGNKKASAQATRMCKQHVEKRKKRQIALRSSAWAKAHRKRAYRKIGALPGWQALVTRLEPGVWYERPEVRELMPEYAYGSVKAWIGQKLWSGGLIERTLNPEHRGVSGCDRGGSQYLYRLTEAGIEKRAVWRALVERQLESTRLNALA